MCGLVHVYSVIIFGVLHFYYSNAIWNFSHVNLSDDVLIWRFASWRNRIFLAVPRWQEDVKDGMTLLEVSYIDSDMAFLLNDPVSLVTAFPNSEMQSFNPINCNNLLSITGLDVDSRGRLWVLDSPESVQCPAKIVYFDLHRNVEIGRSNLTGIPKKALRTLVIDPLVSTWGYRGFIGDPGDDSIIIYNIDFSGRQKWWKLQLQHGPEIPRVYTTDLAISRKNSRLYITGTMSLNLFSIELETLRKFKKPTNGTVLWHGTKMGTSSGLLCDSKDGLHYFLVTQYASVRWETKCDLKAENHAVVLQNEQIPSVTDYLMDSHRNVWGLVNAQQYPLYEKSIDNSTNKWRPINRIIKLNYHTENTREINEL